MRSTTCATQGPTNESFVEDVSDERAHALRPKAEAATATATIAVTTLERMGSVRRRRPSGTTAESKSGFTNPMQALPSPGSNARGYPGLRRGGCPARPGWNDGSVSAPLSHRCAIDRRSRPACVFNWTGWNVPVPVDVWQESFHCRSHAYSGYRLPLIPARPARTCNHEVVDDWGHELLIARSRSPGRVGRIAASGGSRRRTTRPSSQPG